MKKYVFSFVLSICPLLAFSQEGLNASDISNYVYAFDIKDNCIVGKGAEVLKQKIEQSQFTMLGEEHYSPQISELTNALLPVMAKSGYKYFAIETGSYSAEKLVSEIVNRNSLFDFNSCFFEKYNWIPIPFFDGEEDETFLKTAIRQGFEIWGIDQEYISSQLFLIDEIYELSTNKDVEFEKYLNAKQYLEEQFHMLIKKNSPVFENLLNSAILDSFFEKANTVRQQDIIKDLLASWKIYSERGYTNITKRMEYMKNRFSEKYRKESVSHPTPKVFLKMGSIHLGYGKNWLGIYDLGNMIYELAQFNGTKSVSLTCFPRYTLNEDGSIEDSMDEEEGVTYFPILNFAEKDKWVIVDTLPIREIVMNKSIELHENLEMLIFHYDFMIFTPTKTKITPNYRTE